MRAARGPGSSRSCAQLDPQGDLAALGELEGVGQQVLEHLAEAVRVGDDRRRAAVVELDGERQALAVGDRLEGLQHAVAQLGERELADLELDGVGLDLGQVEDVVEELEQVDARGADDVGVLRPGAR